MVNPGAFQGSRREFITAQKDLYAEAVTENHVADTVADIQRRYFKRYPVSLPHNEEPTAEWLASVDDNGPDEDLLPPDKMVLDDEAFKVAQAAYTEQVKLLKFRKEQIARRLSYEYAKDKNPTKRIAVGSEDPMAVLMAKLAGIPLKKPRVRTGFNVWGQNNRQFVDPIYEQRVKDGNVPPKKRAALRTQVYKECFDELDEEERRDYENRAVEEHRAAVKKIDEMINAPPSQAPADRQQVLKNLPNFVQPILDLIAGYTGWKVTLLVGGPEPADQGRLNMMSFHAGETVGNIKMNFGRSERRAYKKFVMPVFGAFLKKCYTIEDCRAAALSDPSSVSLAEVLRMEGGDSFSVDSVEDGITYVKVARPQGSGLDSNAADTSSSPLTYEVPMKVGPPIHSQKQRTSPPPLPNALSMTHTPHPSTEHIPSSRTFIEESRPSLNGQPALAAPPLAPSLAPLRAPSLAPSPLPSPAPSPLLSRRLSATSAPSLANSTAFQPLAQLRLDAPEVPMLSTAQVHVSPAVQAQPILDAPPLQPAAAAIDEGQCSAFSAPPFPSEQTAIRDQGLLPSDPPIGPAVGAPCSTSSLEEELEHCMSPKRLRSSKANNSSPPRKRLRSSKENSPPRRNLRSSKDKGAGVERPQATVRGRRPNPLAAAPAQPSFAMAGSSCNGASTSLTTKDLSGCPDWFLNAYQMLLSKDLGPAWMELVRAWAHFEKESKYRESEKLGTAGRPPCISAWIARARSQGFQPDLGSLPAFEKQFSTWWAGLQPEWRQTGSNGELEKRHGDLEEIRRPGKNGILSVLAALFFWGTYGKKTGYVDWEAVWTQAVNDVCWVIQTLCSN